MATLIFKDIEDFKTYVGGAANVSVEMDSLGPIMLMTAETHLLPWLGRLFWNALVQAVKDDNLSLFSSLLFFKTGSHPNLQYCLVLIVSKSD